MSAPTEVQFTRLPISLPCPVPVLPGTPRTRDEHGEPIPLERRTEACAVDAFWMIGSQVTCDIHLREACEMLGLDFDSVVDEVYAPYPRQAVRGARERMAVPWGERHRYAQSEAVPGCAVSDDAATIDKALYAALVLATGYGKPETAKQFDAAREAVGRLVAERDEWKREAELSKWPKDAAQEHHRMKFELTRCVAERDELRARLQAIESCDCIPDKYSSRACPKCGRRGVQHEHKKDLGDGSAVVVEEGRNV